jgi:transposase
MRRQEIAQEQKAELEVARKANKDKNVEKRLRVLVLRSEGKSNKEIAEKTGYSVSRVSAWVSKYCKQGLDAVIENRYKGNRRNMSFAEEVELLHQYKEQAERGQLVEISVIKAAYEEKVGHAIGSAQIYRVLHRHGWRKVMPRSRHPKKADAEAIEASKKLTRLSEMSWKILQQGASD